MADEEPKPTVDSGGLSRFKILSVDNSSPTKAAAADSEEKIISEGATIDHEYGFGDPLLEDGFGNLTQWRLSDLRQAFGKHLEDKMNEPRIKEKKQSKLEKLKWYNDRMDRYMKVSLNMYNNEEKLDEEATRCTHFNFEAMQPDTSISLFFAEVIPDGEEGEVTCCKLLGDNDNARCLGCNNQGNPDLKHPVCCNVYVGGHVDSVFPFLIDSDSEDDND